MRHIRVPVRAQGRRCRKLRSPRQGSFAIFGIFCALTFAAIASAGPGRVLRPNYEGTIEGDLATRVVFDVKTNDEGVRKRVFFKVEGLPGQCDDGTAGRSDSLRERVGFVSKNIFHKRDRVDDPVTGYLSVFEIKGRLLSNETARGFIFAETDSYEPPPPGFPQRPDCSSDRKLRWEAEKIGR